MGIAVPLRRHEHAGKDAVIGEVNEGQYDLTHVGHEDVVDQLGRTYSWQLPFDYCGSIHDSESKIRQVVQVRWYSCRFQSLYSKVIEISTAGYRNEETVEMFVSMIRDVA